MKKLTFLLILILAMSLFVPAKAEKSGRIQELEERVLLLENKLQDYDSVKTEVACLESYVNFILSDEYVDWIISQI